MLLRDEQSAVWCWLKYLDPNSLDAFLGALGHRVSDFSSNLQPMPVISLEFIDWLDRNAEEASRILARAATEYAAIPEAPALRSASVRIGGVLARAGASDPCAVHLAGNVPIVNRRALRDHLQDIRNQGEPAIVEVSGESRFGRTHSWYLIRHVAQWSGRRTVWIDLVGPIHNQQRIETVFDQIMAELVSPPARRPSVEGAAPNTVGDRFAVEIARVLRQRTAADEPIWLVFDHLDKRVEPELKAMVKQLAETHLRDPMRRCAIFLLGPGQDLAIEDEYDEIARETVSAFLDDEIIAAAEGVNGLGETPLPTELLGTRINEMLEVARSGERATVCADIGKKLVQLRKEVRA